MRVFHDRLTTTEDRNYLIQMLSSYFKEFEYEKEDVINV